MIENIYSLEKPNLYIASFFPFMYQHKEEILFDKIFKEGIQKFFDLHIKCFKNFSKEVCVSKLEPMLGDTTWWKIIKTLKDVEIGILCLKPVCILLDISLKIKLSGLFNLDFEFTL